MVACTGTIKSDLDDNFFHSMQLRQIKSFCISVTTWFCEWLANFTFILLINKGLNYFAENSTTDVSGSDQRQSHLCRFLFQSWAKTHSCHCVQSSWIRSEREYYKYSTTVYYTYPGIPKNCHSILDRQTLFLAHHSSGIVSNY